MGADAFIESKGQQADGSVFPVGQEAKRGRESGASGDDRGKAGGSPEAPGWRSMEEPEPELGWACDSNRGP